MNEPEICLKPISKKEFEKLSRYPSHTKYLPFIKQFLEGTDEVAELIVPDKTAMKKAHQAILRYAQSHKYPFLIRRRENRLFLLKTEEKNIDPKN